MRKKHIMVLLINLILNYFFYSMIFSKIYIKIQKDTIFVILGSIVEIWNFLNNNLTELP